jgi:hypothetical protein
VKLYIEVVSAVVTLDGAPVLDPFGLFNGGVLTMNTKYLLSCAVQSTKLISKDSQQKRVFFAHTELVASVNWDYEDCHDPYVLLLVGDLGWNGGQKWLVQRGILLQPTGKENGQYERVGALTVPPWLQTTESFDNLLHDMFERPEHSNCSKCILTEKDYQSVKYEDGVAWYTITIV